MYTKKERKEERQSDRDCGVVFFVMIVDSPIHPSRYRKKTARSIQGLHGIHRHAPHVDTEVQTPLDIFLSQGYSRIA